MNRVIILKFEATMERARKEGLLKRTNSPAQPILHKSNLRRPNKLDIVLQSTPPDEDIQLRHAWNATDASSGIFVNMDDKFTFGRHEFTDRKIDAIRGKIGYSHGFHVWQVGYPFFTCGTVRVGVATKEARVDSNKGIGDDQESYGWCRHLNECFHDRSTYCEWIYPWGVDGLKRNKKLVLPEKTYCILDMDEGYLASATDEQYLGVTFRGLKGKTLYPMVSSSIHIDITMKYLGGLNLTDEPSPCACDHCPLLVICEYCKTCANECLWLPYAKNRLHAVRESVHEMTRRLRIRVDSTTNAMKNTLGIYQM